MALELKPGESPMVPTGGQDEMAELLRLIGRFGACSEVYLNLDSYNPAGESVWHCELHFWTGPPNTGKAEDYHHGCGEGPEFGPALRQALDEVNKELADAA
jgi:hypothetical protein